MWSAPAHHPLRRLFAGVTEHAFINTVGVADPPLIDYVSELLARFVSMEAVYRLRGTDGRPLTEVAAMVMEANDIPPQGRTCREFHRHIGDYALFWTGLFPELVRRQQTGFARDAFIDYTMQIFDLIYSFAFIFFGVLIIPRNLIRRGHIFFDFLFLLKPFFAVFTVSPIVVYFIRSALPRLPATTGPV